MAPPGKEKYLIQIDRSKTKMIKFKNGFPPKVVRSKDSFDKVDKPHQRIDLVERELPFKNARNNALQRNLNGRFSSERQQKATTAEPFSDGSTRGFSSSTIKVNRKQGRQIKAPFSPPPTLAELRSLTKKVGRFYTKDHGCSSASSSSSGRNPSHQKAILDIELALSERDVSGLEKCYKRIFQGNAEPIRTIVRNQRLPNQRSRQVSCPIEITGSATYPSSPVRSKAVTSNVSQQRRWSMDSANERLPIVPAPYFRSENPDSTTRNMWKKPIGEGPVMFSTTRHDYRKKTEAPPTTAVVLNIDPEQFPEQSSRALHLDMMTPCSNGAGSRPSKSPKVKKPIVFKPPSQCNQRAPNSTPEPRLGNEMQIISGRHKDLLPQVFPAQLRHNPERQSQNSEPYNRRIECKLSKNRFDTSEASTEPQASEERVDRRAITDDVLTERKRVLTSGEDSETECDYNDLKLHESELHKRAGDSGLTSVSVKLVSSDNISGEAAESSNVITNIDAGTDLLEKNIEEDTDLSIKSSMVESINLQGLDINSVPSSVSDTDENLIVDFKSASPGNHTAVLYGSRNCSSKSSTREAEMNELKSSGLDNVTVVVVNVTTDEGEDVNADIYEYNRKKELEAAESFVQSMEAVEETDMENGQPARNRKEELEALLKEHSSIVEQVKNLSEDCDS